MSANKKQEPQDDAPLDVKWLLRLDADLAAAIDARVLATGSRSRNQWLTKALSWAVAQPVRTTTREEHT